MLSISGLNFVRAAFVVSWTYWGYLYATSAFVVQFDAIGYESLAEVIYKQGWTDFFRTGPNREPFYPWMIAMAMGLGDALGISYEWIIKAFQIVFLASTQWGMYMLLRAARVRRTIAAVVVLYFGFSPGILNAALSLFSEIAAMPFVVFAILTAAHAFKTIPSGNALAVIRLGMLFGGVMLLATTAKGIFEYVFWIMILPFVYACIKNIVGRHKIVSKRYAVFIVAGALVMSVGVHTYKSLNYRYNGNYVFTNRALALLYGNTMKRTNTLPPRYILAHVANVPGDGFCKKWFTKEECHYADFSQADFYRLSRSKELTTGLQEEQDKKLKAIVIERFKERPFQFALLTFVESLRMFFWESTRIGFVEYPLWLQEIYLTEWFSDGLRAIVSVMTALAFGAAVWLSLRMRWLGSGGLQASEMRQEWHIIGMIVILIIAYTGLYSLFSIVSRYALVVAPLDLVLIGWMAERLARKRSGCEV